MSTNVNKYNFSESKIKDILDLKPREFYVLYKTIEKIWYSKGYVHKNELRESLKMNVSISNFISITEKLGTLGLLKIRSDGKVFYGDYDNNSKNKYEFNNSDFVRPGNELSIEELYVYFMLLFRSIVGSCVITEKERKSISKSLEIPFLASRMARLKEIEGILTTKGFLAPIIYKDNKIKYVLYNGEGSLASYDG